jgi:hypothetical protein
MSLEIQVAELTTETTNLLEAVNVKKQALDDSVDSASSSASSASSSSASASSSATTAQNAEGQTLIYRDEAKQHRDDAAAVVTGGTAALEPEPGKIPLADSAGRMDHRWLGGEYIAHLLGAVAQAIDLAGSAGREVLPSQTVEQILQGLAVASDLAGQAARAVGGGEVLLRAGSGDNPSLSRPSDRDTGLFFPGMDSVAVSTAGVEAMRIDPAGRVGFGTTAPSGVIDINDDKVRVRNQKTPASATDSGNAGEIAWDADYIYVCTATNAWKRAALTTW